MSTYTEEDLLQVYEDLLALPPSQATEAQVRAVGPDPHVSAVTVVQAAIGRLCPSTVDGIEEPLHRVLINRLADMASELEIAGSSLGLKDITDQIPLSVVTGKEWEALIQCAVSIVALIYMLR